MASARDRRHANWFWLNKSLLDDYGKALGVQGIAVYALLARCANEQGHAIPSLRYMAETLGIGVNTVQRALDTLEREGLIARRRRWSERGDFTSTEYILLTIEEKAEGGVSRVDTRVSSVDTPPTSEDTGVSRVDTGVSRVDTRVSSVGEQVYPGWTHGVSEVNNEQEPVNKNQMEQDPEGEGERAPAHEAPASSLQTPAPDGHFMPVDFTPSAALLAQITTDCPHLDVGNAIKRCMVTTFRRAILDPGYALHKFCLEEEARQLDNERRHPTRASPAPLLDDQLSQATSDTVRKAQNIIHRQPVPHRPRPAEEHPYGTDRSRLH